MEIQHRFRIMKRKLAEETSDGEDGRIVFAGHAIKQHDVGLRLTSAGQHTILHCTHCSIIVQRLLVTMDQYLTPCNMHTEEPGGLATPFMHTQSTCTLPGQELSGHAVAFTVLQITGQTGLAACSQLRAIWQSACISALDQHVREGESRIPSSA